MRDTKKTRSVQTAGPGRRATLWCVIFVALLCLGMTFQGAAENHQAPQGRPLSVQDALEDTLHIEARITSGNSIGLTVFNDGTMGNNLRSRSPSLEYPVGSEEEHLVRGGLWVGGLFDEEGDFSRVDTLVTHATLDGYAGSSESESEFIPDPVNWEFIERSILPNHRYFDPNNAKSEQDLICEYIDTYTPGEDSDHRPLHISVIQEILQFSFEPFDGILLINFHFVNDHATAPIYDLHAGLYAELASGWKDGHDEWPPSGWFRRKDIAYVDSLRLISEHHHTLDGGNCPSWAGYMLLGTRPDTIAAKTVSFNWWNWDPGGNLDDTPKNDADRFIRLSDGSIDATRGVEAPNNDPVTLLAVGPLGTDSFFDADSAEHQILWAGDTVTVSYAFVGGTPTPQAEPPRNAEEDIAFNAVWAQTAFDLNFNIPVPPPSPDLHVESSHATMSLWWDDQPLEFIDPKSRTQDFEGFRVYLSEVGKAEEFDLLGEFDLVDTLFYNTGLDSITPTDSLVILDEFGDSTVYRYRYDVRGLRDGFKYWVAVTSFDTGSPDIESLESGITQNRTFTIPGARSEEVVDQGVVVFPNPYHGDAAWDEPLERDRYLWFAGLPRRCKIRIYNLAGDLIHTIDFDGAVYGATDVRGIYDPDDVWNPAREIPVLSGGMAAWDLTSRKDQAIATGLYIFSVEDLDTGEIDRGRFLIMK
ncbi:hypothetical protein ACFL6M_04085 [Candidatus Eisenbacteria bacterium]|uniref:Uncharacterized protein n=1 Tax=Eiseniibacteriota bacterium TaxID=2212470 RepID=A0ABV6YKA6_UNCEI